MYSEVMVGSQQLWYYLHFGLQWLGMAAFVVGFAIPFVKAPWNGAGGDVGAAHKWLGVAVMILAGLQVSEGKDGLGSKAEGWHGAVTACWVQAEGWTVRLR